MEFRPQRIMNAVTCAGGVVNYTDVIDVSGLERFALHVVLDWVAGTRVDIAPEVSYNGTVWFPLQSAAVVAGVGTLHTFEYQKATGGADINFAALLNTEAPYYRFACEVVNGTTDTLTIVAARGKQQGY